MVFQHLIAGFGQLGTIFLEAGQNGEIALIDYRAAEALDIARTGLLLLRGATARRLLLLRHRGGGHGDRQQGEY